MNKILYGYCYNFGHKYKKASIVMEPITDCVRIKNDLEKKKVKV